MKNLVTRSLLPTIILLCVGLVMALVGLLTLTVARPQTNVQATMAAPSTPYIISREGVFELTSAPMTVTATAAENEEITLVVGKSKDIHAWLQESSYTEVTGLESWEKLQFEVVDGKAEDLANPAKSDMWVEVLTGTGSVTYTTSDASKGLALLATVDGKAAAPKLELNWVMVASPLWRVALLVAGLLLALIGAALLWLLRSGRIMPAVEEVKAAEVLVAEVTEVAEESESEEAASVEVSTDGVVSAEVSATEEAVTEEVAVESVEEPALVEAVVEEETTETVADAEASAEDIPEAATAEEDEPVHERKHGAVIETRVGERSIKFPSRQAIKEARLRGESVIEIDGHTFQTGLIPVVKKVKEVAEADLGGE